MILDNTLAIGGPAGVKTPNSQLERMGYRGAVMRFNSGVNGMRGLRGLGMRVAAETLFELTDARTPLQIQPNTLTPGVTSVRNLRGFRGFRGLGDDPTDAANSTSSGGTSAASIITGLNSEAVYLLNLQRAASGQAPISPVSLGTGIDPTTWLWVGAALLGFLIFERNK